MATNKKNQKIIEAMKTFLVDEKDFHIDRWGNCVNKEGNRRYKFSATSCRIEIKLSTGRWYKVGGYYYKDICTIGDNNINDIIRR